MAPEFLLGSDKKCVGCRQVFVQLQEIRNPIVYVLKNIFNMMINIRSTSTNLVCSTSCKLKKSGLTPAVYISLWLVLFLTLLDAKQQA